MKISPTVFVIGAFLVLGVFLPNTSILMAQSKVTAESKPSNATPRAGTSITVDINIDVSGTLPAELLGSFSGTLSWNSAALGFTSHSGLKGGFTGLVNTTNIGTGQIAFNGANPSGAG